MDTGELLPRFCWHKHLPADLALPSPGQDIRQVLGEALGQPQKSSE